MRISNNILEHPALISFVRLVQTSRQFHSIQSYLDNWQMFCNTEKPL